MSQKSLVPLNALSSASAPSTPTLQTGDLYYNTTTGLQVYNGTAWVAAGSGGGITGVTAGTGLSGGGTSGTVTVSLDGTVTYGYTTTATAAGTTTLTAASTPRQFFTGTSTQTIVLPVASTMVLGETFKIHNNSTGTLTVNSSGGNLVFTAPSGTTWDVTCILTSGTTAASWDADYEGSTTITGTGNNVLSDSPTFTGSPIATTAAQDTNSTRIATTAFVVGQASGSNPLALGSVAQGSSLRYSRQDHVHPTTGLGLTSGTLAQFASTTSSQLAGVISDETGSGSLVFATAPTISSPLLQSPEERWTVSATAATGTVTFNSSTQGVLYYTTNATGNWTLNVTNVNSNLAVGDAMSIVFAVTNGTTAYRPTGFQIDGTTRTVLWAGGVAPAAGNASAVDWYSYVIVKTAATPTYTVFAGQSAKFA